MDNDETETYVSKTVREENEETKPNVQLAPIVDSDELETEDIPLQLCTSFPNDNSKQIDFVLHIRDKTDKIINDDDQNLANNFSQSEIDDYYRKYEAREAMLSEIREEGLEIYEFPPFQKGSSTHTYKLLHCPKERLLREAEDVKLEVDLKDQIPQEKVEDQFSFKKIKNKIFHDKIDFVCSAQYDNDYRHLFNLDENNPFSTTIRSLLVDSILTNIDFRMGEEPIKRNWKAFFAQNEERRTEERRKLKHKVFLKNKEFGLSYLIKEKIVEDCYQLHDCTSDKEMNLKYNSIMVDTTVFRSVQETNYFMRSLQQESLSNKNLRSDLNREWAQFRNMFKMQPMRKIRDYFGEEIGLYFAWAGILITTLWFPSLIGLIFFFIGFDSSFNSDKSRAENYTDAYSKLEADFVRSFDNDLTPAFAILICMWGAIFIEFFKRRNAELAHDWNTAKYEKFEPELPAYKQRRMDLAKIGGWSQYFFENKYELKFKLFITLVILTLMIGVSIVLAALVILYRVYITLIAYPDDAYMKLILGSVGSVTLSTIYIMILDFLYGKIALQTTIWENHQTNSAYQNSLSTKIFFFQFANSYITPFYLAFFRTYYPGGIFGVGEKYQDLCANNDCMSLLSLQIFSNLLIKPIAPFFKTVLVPIINIFTKKMRQLSKGNKLNTEKVKPVSAGQSKEEFNRKIKEPEYVKDLRERCVKAYIVAEKNRTACDDTIRNEYETKTILFGYIALFGCSFSLAPLIFLIVCLFDLRIDGKRLIWLYQRPVGMRAQDIGNWYYICTFLNALGIITNGLIITFTSNWSDNGLIKDSYTNRLLFFIVFEHFMFVLWFVIKWLIPDISIDVKKRMEEEMYHVNAVMFSEKLEKKKQSKANENQTITETSETVKKRKNKKKHRQRDELIEDREAESLKYENNLPTLPKKYEKVQRRLVKEDSMRYYDDSLKILNV